MRSPHPDMLPGNSHSTARYGRIEIIAYESCRAVTVKFQRTGTTINTTADAIRRGFICDLYAPSVSGVGFLGEGPFSWASHPAAYTKWASMLERVYNPLSASTAKDYFGCAVEDEWHSLQNFSRWFVVQPFAGEKGYELDKDLMKIGNKIYSPHLCQNIPKELNMLLRHDKRQNTWGAGVDFNRDSGSFSAKIRSRGVIKHLGMYKTAVEASEAYAAAHKLRIVDIADKLLEEQKITQEQRGFVDQHVEARR